MQRVVLAAAGMLALAWASSAPAALCPKCRDLLFLPSDGKCSACGEKTASGALRLCPKCSAEQHKCEHCLAALDGPAGAPAEKPPAEKPPAELPPPRDLPGMKPLAEPPAVLKPPAVVPVDPTRGGTYTSGKWQYRLDILEPRTRNEGRWGWLWYGGRKLPRGEINDYYRTPWGPIFWVGVSPSRSGAHGWMPAPLGENARQGRPLAVPPMLADAPPRSQSLEVSKADNGKLARLRVGNVVIIRLRGDPTTGYQWLIAAPPGPAIRLAGQPQYTPQPHPPGAMGSGGTYAFIFQAVQPGAGVIRLVYAQPPDRNAQPPARNRPAADSFTLTVDVLAAPAPASTPTKPASPPLPRAGGREF